MVFFSDTLIFICMTPLPCAGLIVVRDHKLLLAFSNNKQAWYLPGGKISKDETALAALQREIAEELNLQLVPHQLEWYTHIIAPAFGETGLEMHQDCFRCLIPIQPVPSAEIGDLRYFSLAEYALQPQQVPGVLLAFEQLEKDGML